MTKILFDITKAYHNVGSIIFLEEFDYEGVSRVYNASVDEVLKQFNREKDLAIKSVFMQEQKKVPSRDFFIMMKLQLRYAIAV